MIRLAFREVGQGQPLIILHGLFGSSDNWQTFAKMISDRYRVISLDIRNHGLSPHTEEFSYELISSDLLEFIRDQGLESIYLMGHSMGGKAAAHFALQYPEKVSKLILLDIAMKAYPAHHEVYFKAMRSMDLDKITTRAEADAWLLPDIPTIAVRQFILKNLVRDGEGKFRWKFNLEALYQHYDKINTAIESARPFLHPVLLLSGEYSNYIQTEDIPEMKTLFPLLDNITIMEAGHWIHADQPVRLKEVVVEFLGAVE
ncbi:MAG: alpha/beta fold hydrolase [Saprospiraceae bacterium]|nr:alpha/beta fold hydrolase [Saprospiraceae bacterium]